MKKTHFPGNIYVIYGYCFEVFNMSIPDSIKRFKPTDFGAVEIRFIGGKYYVYKISSKWNPQTKKCRKVTGEIIGKITEESGFVPNLNGMKLTTPLYPVVKQYGAYEILRQLSGDLEDRLKEHFPDIYRELSIMAMLRLITGCNGKTMGKEYERSQFNEIYPDLKYSYATIKTIIGKLTNRQGNMDAFMKSYISKCTSLLFDGTSIFTRAKDSYSQSGYNPQHSLNPQVRLLYIFDKESYLPVFYRMIPGNIVDRSALVQTITECGSKNCIVICDKGFYSKTNLSFMMEKKIQFIIPLQSNTTMIPKDFETNQDDHKYDGRFVYHKRLIWYKKLQSGVKGNFIYIYRDDQKKNLAEIIFTEKEKACYGEDENQDFFSDCRRGMFAYSSNIDESCEQIYRRYKERWDIEQCFDYLKNSVSIGAPYKRTNEELQAWAFVNHISLLYFYGTVKALRNNGITDVTPEEIINIGKNIYKVRDNLHFGEDRISEITDSDKKLLESIGVDLLRKNS